MDVRPDRGRPMPLRAMTTAGLLALLCSLAACQKAEEAAPTEPAITAEAAPAPVAAPAPAPAPAPPAPGEWSGTVPEPAAAKPAAPDDLFVGWYYEQGGAGRLLACGQAEPLQVSDPTFMRQLKAKRGGGPEPVYVRLHVRLAPESRLEVTDVQQFGVDEGPAPNCELVAKRR